MDRRSSTENLLLFYTIDEILDICDLCPEYILDLLIDEGHIEIPDWMLIEDNNEDEQTQESA